MILRRTSPTALLNIKAVSDNALPNGGTILAMWQKDVGKYSMEYLYSTDSALLGMRGLYNFGADPRHEPHPYERAKETVAPSTAESTLIEGFGSDIKPTSPSILSVGGEVYYGALSKSFGISTGARFTTLPAHTGFPYTMTLTLNPLMGNLSSTYSVKAGQHVALSTKFDFNFYSYESGVMVGCELWRKRQPSLDPVHIIFAEAPQLERETLSKAQGVSEGSGSDHLTGEASSSGSPSSSQTVDEDIAGVLKARVDQNWRIGLLWEGRFKELLYSVGATLDLKKRDQVFRGIGVELSYSS